MEKHRKYPLNEDKFRELIEPFIKEKPKKQGRPTKICHYKFFCGVLYVLRTGIPWRDLPSEYGNWHTIYTRYKRWSENGFFWDLLYHLQSFKQLIIDVVFVDGSIVPLHRHGGGALKKAPPQSVGRGRKGLGTTMHMAISNNSVINCMLFPAQRQDCRSFEDLSRSWPWDEIGYVVADKGYASSNVKRIIIDNNAQPVIPPKGIYILEGSNLTIEDCYDIKLYRTKHIIERLFGRLKENKRLAMRFDKLDCNFLSLIALVLIKLYKLFC